MAEQQITAQQIEQALQVVSDACSRSEPPAGASLSNWQWTDTTRASLNILAAVARKVIQQAEPDAAAPTESVELVDVSSNGDQ